MQNLYIGTQELDKRCYDKYALSEDILMEHAALALAHSVRSTLPASSVVTIVCGSGNNGADGIAAARLLHPTYRVTILMPFGVGSEMAKLQLDRAKKVGLSIDDKLQECDLLIDALFGSGLSRDIDTKTAKLIKMMNSIDAIKIACDIPSGLRADGTQNLACFKADVTVTMGALKLCLYSDSAKDFVGDITVANLGVERDLYETDSSYRVLDLDDIDLPNRHHLDVHKGSFGHLGVVCGEMSGAAIISANSALRFGTGLVTLLCNEEITAPYELMRSHSLPSTLSAVALGMGLGQEFSEQELLALLNHDLPLLLDADIFSHPILNRLLSRDNLVLTPHPKEFVQLLKTCEIDDIDVQTLQKDRFGYVKKFCKLYPNATLVLKGANVIIAQNEQLFINPHGTNILAKGGSGDVLSGLIGALLAQNYTPLRASITGSLAHTKLASMYRGSDFSLKPSDLIELLKSL